METSNPENMNPQERILGKILESMDNGMQHSNYELIATIKDCFTIERLQNRCNELYTPAAFGSEVAREELIPVSAELDALLSKYGIVTITTEEE